MQKSEDLKDHSQKLEPLYEYNANMLQSFNSGAYEYSEYTAIPLEITEDSVVQHTTERRRNVIPVEGGMITKDVKVSNRRTTVRL